MNGYCAVRLYCLHSTLCQILSDYQSKIFCIQFTWNEKILSVKRLHFSYCEINLTYWSKILDVFFLSRQNETWNRENLPPKKKQCPAKIASACRQTACYLYNKIIKFAVLRVFVICLDILFCFRNTNRIVRFYHF